MNLPWSSLDLKVTIKFEVGVWVLLTDLLMHYLMGVLESGDVLHHRLYFDNFIRQVFYDVLCNECALVRSHKRVLWLITIFGILCVLFIMLKVIFFHTKLFTRKNNILFIGN